MIKNSVTLQDVVSLLNESLKYDYAAVSSLFSTRVSCNEEIADHE
jgi:hypothetical protein